MSESREAVIEQSRAMTRLRDDWDGEGSVGYAVETWERATDFLRSLGAVPLPLISPAEKGSVDLYWQLVDRTLLMNFPATAGYFFFGKADNGRTIGGHEGDMNLPGIAGWLNWPPSTGRSPE